MEQLFGRPIITQEDIKKRIDELGRQITEDFKGRDLLLVGVLKGAVVFYADLIRAINLPIRYDVLLVSSRRSTAKGHRIKVVSDMTQDVEGRDVLLVEDIVDSGMTLSHLKKQINARRSHD